MHRFVVAIDIAPGANARGEGPVMAKLDKDDGVRRYVYSVKYLCGIFEPFPNVVHWTEINVHNPSDRRAAKLTKKFVVAGTQKNPTGPTHREKLELPPNGAFEIDCNEIYELLGLPFHMATKGFVEITSDRKIQVVAIYDKCAKQPHTDVFEDTEAAVTIQWKTNPDGDFDLEFDLSLTGRTVIKKSDQRLCDDCTRFYIGTEIIDMSMSVAEVTAVRHIGDDEKTTDIRPDEVIDMSGLRIVQSPVYPTRGKITGPVDPETLQHDNEGISSFFEVFFDVILPPDLEERYGTLVNHKALLLESKLTQVEPPEPPTDDDPPKNEYRTPQAAIPLVSTASGKVIAQIKAHKHTPNPEPKEKPKRRKHAPVPCENASIDVEYVEPVLALTNPREY